MGRGSTWGVSGRRLAGLTTIGGLLFTCSGIAQPPARTSLRESNRKDARSVEVLANTELPYEYLMEERDAVFVESRGLTTIDHVSLSVSLNGIDVSHLVTIESRMEYEHVRLSEGGSRIIEERIDLFLVDLSMLAPSPGDTIRYETTVTGPAGPIPASPVAPLTVSTLPPSEDRECIAGCVCQLVSALGANRGSDGKIHFGATQRNPASVADAVSSLYGCIEACAQNAARLPRVECEIPLAGGGVETIAVAIDARPADGTGGRNASASSSTADLVIAIAGPGDSGSSTSSGNGCNATATASKAGAAAVAIGGSGGSHPSGPGDGGDATARSTASSDHRGGDVIAFGGAGGGGQSSGGDGGNASAISTGGAATAAIAMGGEGGDPVNDGAIGGRGGNAMAQTGANSATVAGGGSNPGEPLTNGFHGGPGNVPVPPPGTSGAYAKMGAGGGLLVYGRPVPNR